MDTTKLPKAPCVGENVVWYPHGDIKQAPFAATVVSRLNDECVTLYTLSATGRREPMLNVKHVYHPDHNNSPIGVKRWGAWDLIGAHEKREREIKEQEESRREQAIKEAEKNAHVEVITSVDPDEDEMRIIRYAREHKGDAGRAQAVAERIGAGMTHQRVNAILRKFPHFLNGELTINNNA